MRATPKTIQPPRSELDKLAKERIIEHANGLFTSWGVNVSSVMIAHYAHTNVANIIRHFGTRDHLVFNFLKSLMKDAELRWKEIEQECPTILRHNLGGGSSTLNSRPTYLTRQRTRNCHALR
jgi:hypothetical protein